jgi:hypothetical protein
MDGRQTNSPRCAGGFPQLRSKGKGRNLHFTAENAEIAERLFFYSSLRPLRSLR